MPARAIEGEFDFGAVTPSSQVIDLGGFRQNVHRHNFEADAAFVHAMPVPFRRCFVEREHARFTASASLAPTSLAASDRVIRAAVRRAYALGRRRTVGETILSFSNLLREFRQRCYRSSNQRFLPHNNDSFL